MEIGKLTTTEKLLIIRYMIEHDEITVRANIGNKILYWDLLSDEKGDKIEIVIHNRYEAGYK